MAALDIYRDDGLHRSIEIGRAGIRLGRALENDLVLEDVDKSVSRFHAEVRLEQGRYVVEDLNSQNGIWIDHRRVAKETLENGATFTIGPYRLVFDERGVQTDSLVGAYTLGREPAESGWRALTPTPLAVPPAAVAPTHKASTPGRSGQSALSLRNLAIIAGGVVAGIVAIVVIVQSTAGRPRLEAPPPPSANVEPELTVPEVADTAGQMASARRLLAAGRFQEAASEIEAVLRADPGNTQAQGIVSQIEQSMSRTRLVAPTTTAASRAWPAGLPPVGVRTGESMANRESRARLLHERYVKARATLDAGEFQSAIHEFDAIVGEEPGYLDVAQHTADAHRRRAAQQRSLAARHVDEARNYERTGQLLQAASEYAAAIDLDSSIPGVQEGMASLRERMREEGDQAFKSAYVADSRGRFQEARSLYEKAWQHLPASDPRVTQARERLSSIPKE